MDNSERSNKSTTPVCTVQLRELSPTELWLISILKANGHASLSWLGELYAKAKARDPLLSKESARHYLYRVVNHLQALGLVDLTFDDSRLLTVKLKCVPLLYRNPPEDEARKFDLRYSSRPAENLVNFASGVKKIQVKPSDLKDLRIKEWKFFWDSSLYRRRPSVHAKVTPKDLKRAGLRFQRRLSEERKEALSEIAGLPAILDKSTTHYDLDYLFDEYEKRLRQSVIVLWDKENERYLTLPARSRFIDPKLLKRYYDRAERGLKRAFRKYHDAIFTTLTLPPVLPLVLRVPELDGFILLQDSVLSYVLRRLTQLIRYMWPDQDVRKFTAYEFHGDGRTHAHSLFFGVTGTINWNRLMGRKKEPALEYYARKYGIKVTRNLRKRPQRLAKFVLTKVLDHLVIEALTNVDNTLGTHFLQAYLSYKEAKGIDGPVNEVHRIRDGRWAGSKPKDAKGPDAIKYVLKYLLKMIRELQARALGLSKGLLSLKLLGYWLFTKSFYRASRGLLGPPLRKKAERKYNYVGVWRIIDLPEYVKPYYLIG